MYAQVWTEATKRRWLRFLLEPLQASKMTLPTYRYSVGSAMVWYFAATATIPYELDQTGYGFSLMTSLVAYTTTEAGSPLTNLTTDKLILDAIAGVLVFVVISVLWRIGHGK